MNFGQNLYNWFLSNAQSLVLLAIVVIGLYLGFKREFSKLIGFLIIAIIAVYKCQYKSLTFVNLRFLSLYRFKFIFNSIRLTSNIK